MADTVSELLPCPNPWCGFSAGTDIFYLKRAGWRVGCDCGVKAPFQSDREKAITAWNTRASTQPAPAFPREEVARKLCEQHGGDPDAVATDKHDCWEGPLWTAFLRDADDLAALLRENRA